MLWTRVDMNVVYFASGCKWLNVLLNACCTELYRQLHLPSDSCSCRGFRSDGAAWKWDAQAKSLSAESLYASWHLLAV